MCSRESSRHAAVFCIDEKTAIQALDRRDRVLPLSPGRVERHGFDVQAERYAVALRGVEQSDGRGSRQDHRSSCLFRTRPSCGAPRNTRPQAQAGPAADTVGGAAQHRALAPLRVHAQLEVQALPVEHAEAVADPLVPPVAGQGSTRPRQPPDPAQPWLPSPPCRRVRASRPVADGRRWSRPSDRRSSTRAPRVRAQGLLYRSCLYPTSRSAVGGWREYFDHEVGCSPHVLVGDRVFACPGDEQQVGLHDVGV